MNKAFILRKGTALGRCWGLGGKGMWVPGLLAGAHLHLSL